ncbi:MAG: thiol reductant ABC exporter subunit CydC, partial [Actinomycetota bacterium]
VDGVDVHDLDPVAWNDRLAVIPQLPRPLASTVANEVCGDLPIVPAMVDDALSAVGLAGFGSRRPAELSGGQLRRVQVARATAMVRAGHASVIVADEPTAQLDQVAAESVVATLRTAARDDGAVVLVATHDERLAAEADQIVEIGTTLRPSPATEAGSPTATARPSTSPPGTPLGDSVVASEPTRADPQTDGSTWRSAVATVLDTARPARRRLLGAAALGSLAEICTLGLAGLSAWLIVRASEQPEISAVALVVTGVRAFGIGKGVFRYTERLATHDAGLRALAELRATVVGRLAAAPPGALSDLHRGDVATRVVDDIDRLLDLFVRVLVPTISIAVATTLTLAVTLVIDPRAALVLVVGATLASVVIPMASFRAERQCAGARNATAAALRAATLDITDRAELLVASRRASSARATVDRLGDDIDEIERGRATARARTAALLAAAPVYTVAATLAVIGSEAAQIGAPLFGVLVLWPLASIELNTAVDDAATSLPAIGDAAQRVADILARAPAESGHDTAITDHPPLHLAHLTATWPTTGRGVGPVELGVEPGARIAVTGPSGSGKSTLAAALVRFCPIADGRYLLGNVDAVSEAADAVRRTVTWVDQAPWIADTSIRENLRIADRGAADDAMIEALRTVALGAWFDALPAGLDTHVGRHGTAMSGGEAHRLALARVLLTEHVIVVLDEPTSHLDAATATSTISGLAAAFGDRSVIVMAHDAPPPGFATGATLHASTTASAAASI